MLVIHLQKVFELRVTVSLLPFPQENIDCDMGEEDAEGPEGAGPLVGMIDRPPAAAAMMRSSQTDLRRGAEAERRGLLWLLEEEANQLGASDASFIDRLFSNYSDRGECRNLACFPV